MRMLTRRSIIRGSLGLAAAGTLARPYIANAAAKTATVWWVQGFAEEEDISFKKIVADYQKASGNTIDYSITPYAPMRQKIVAAVQSGVVPDLYQNTPGEIIALKAWDAFYDFFKEVQKKLRAQGARKVYAMGFQLNTTGNDSNALFNYFLIANGGQDIVTTDGKLHLDDPKVREAAIKALTYPTTAYKEGFVPPGAINWNDADDNNAFHAKQIVMDLDGSLSTEVAIIKNEQDYDDIVTTGLALGNDGKPVPSKVDCLCGLIPKGAKNVATAKDFLKFLIQPQVLNEYLKTGLGRNLPAMPAIVKDDPWWLDPKDPHRV